jgi:hypothetical protein
MNDIVHKTSTMGQKAFLGSLSHDENHLKLSSPAIFMGLYNELTHSYRQGIFEHHSSSRQVNRVFLE